MNQNSETGDCGAFSLMVKPMGSACNMRCGYCYYLQTAGSNAAGRMSPATLRKLLERYFAAASDPAVTITWHGGEPMLAGLDFYRDAVEAEKEFLPPGWNAGITCRPTA